MRGLSKVVIGAAFAIGLTATAASADIVCNRDGDCWHVRERHQYRPQFGLVVHPDNWAWGKHEARHYRWREHDGRGYWRRGVWIGF